MPNFEKLYFELFAAMADAIEAIEGQNYGAAREILIAAQQTAEAQYLEEP